MGAQPTRRLAVHRVSSRTSGRSTLRSRIGKLLENQVFRRSRQVTFSSYGSRRSRWALPRWLVLLLGGAAIGAGGTITVQERYLAPRLSAGASAQLRSAYGQAELDRQRLKAELGEANKQLEIARSDKGGLADALAASRATADRLRTDLSSVVEGLPPDPRGGSVEVRAGQFTAKGAVLNYSVVLMRESRNSKPLAGVMQLVVAGESERGTKTTLALAPISLSVGSHEVVRGSVPLPQGFRPRQTTVQVLDRVAGKPLGMRVLPVK